MLTAQMNPPKHPDKALHDDLQCLQAVLQAVVSGLQPRKKRIVATHPMQ